MVWALVGREVSVVITPTNPIARNHRQCDDVVDADDGMALNAFPLCWASLSCREASPIYAELLTRRFPGQDESPGLDGETRISDWLRSLRSEGLDPSDWLAFLVDICDNRGSRPGFVLGFARYHCRKLSGNRIQGVALLHRSPNRSPNPF